MLSALVGLVGSACGTVCYLVAKSALSQEKKEKKKSAFAAIGDNLKTMADVHSALRSVGLETSQLIIGIDFTKSNTYNGRVSFGGKSLHALGSVMNPYQRVIDVMGRTLEPFDEDHLIPVYGFGDEQTTDRNVFSFTTDEVPLFGISEVLARYTELVTSVKLSGPTTFAPLIKKAIEIVQKTRQYHILLIITDGEISDPKTTADAIVEASNYALSIVAVGIGDADFGLMHEFDDELPERRFDNFQFVEFNKIVNDHRIENVDVAFAVAALQEVPEQWQRIKELRLL